MSIYQFTRRLGATAIALSAVMLVAGCASFGASAPEDVVKNRAGEYWKARMAAQYEKAYALSTPSYRKLRSAEQFRLQFGAGANIQAAEVINVNCEPEKCTARMKLSVKPAIIGLNLNTIDTFLDETWLLEEGQWWHHQEL